MDNYFWFVVFVLLNASILFLLTANVSRLRLKLGISIGDAGNKDMLYAMRAHANGLEQVLIFSLLILALTFVEAANFTLALFVIVFTVARVFHAYGMLGKSFGARRIGAGLTYLLQLLAIVALAVMSIGSL